MKSITFYALLVTFIVMAMSTGCKKELDVKETDLSEQALTGSKFAALSGSTADYAATTIVGDVISGYVNGRGTATRFNYPYKAAGSDGYLYLADFGNNAIRKVKISDRTVTTLAGGNGAGYADGTGTNAKFNQPYEIVLGTDNNFYVADQRNFKIRKVSRTGVVTTFAGTDSGYVDGPANVAKFGYIYAMAVAKDGSLYVYDHSAYKIRKITKAGVVSTFAGSTYGDAVGPGANAKFSYISAMDFAADGALYVTDTYNNKIKKITPDGTVSVYAGSSSGHEDGIGTQAKFGGPTSIIAMPNGKFFVGEVWSGFLRLLTPGPSGPMVTTVAGHEHMHSNEQSYDGVGFGIVFSTLSDLVYYNKALYIPGEHLVQQLTLPDKY